MWIEYMDAFVSLFWAQLTDSAKEVEWLMVYRQSSPLLEKCFQFCLFVGLIILFDLFCANMRPPSQIIPPMKHRFSYWDQVMQVQILRACHIWAINDRKAGSGGTCCRTVGKKSLHNCTRVYSKCRLRSIGEPVWWQAAMIWRAFSTNCVHCWVFCVQAWRRRNRLIPTRFWALGVGNHLNNYKLRG